jgi:acetyl-CoA synthetase
VPLLSWPFFGIEPAVVDDHGNSINDNTLGKLIIKNPWPGMMKTIYGDHQRFINNYFKKFPGNYLTGDEARRDEDGYYWVIGRDDDVIKVSGHRLGTGELESAFITHPSVSEVAVVSIPNEIKGQGIYAFVATKEGVTPTDELKKELIQHIRQTIGPIATPEFIQWATDLPKTRSGKIMRRILRKIASDEFEELGDISTLANPGVVEELIGQRKKILT